MFDDISVSGNDTLDVPLEGALERVPKAFVI
jgi:hypothetical protein